MPFKAYLPVGFPHSHESRTFDQLTDAFNRWVTPSNLSHLRAAHFSEMRDIGWKGLQKLDQELRHLGITTLLQRR